MVSDPGASCDGQVIPGAIVPGQSVEIDCTGPTPSNTATVTCDIQGAFDANGDPKTIEDEDTGDCIELDKQVSCDGGATWNDVGYGDGIVQGCTGWVI